MYKKPSHPLKNPTVNYENLEDNWAYGVLNLDCYLIFNIP